MSKFSLMTVSKENDEGVTGYWIQDHIGTIESATTLANATSKINSNQKIAVVEPINSTTPILGYYKNLKRLN